MNRPRHHSRVKRQGHWLAWLCMVACLLGPCWAAVLAADAYDERRVRTGARLLRALLAADVDLETKATLDGGLLIWVYGHGGEPVEDAIELIGAPDEQGRSQLRGLDVSLQRLDDMPAADAPAAVALFLAEPPDDTTLDALIQWGIERHVIVYSPFEGHVERGALGGVAIEAKVRPYINLRTMEAAGVELKPFFLKVAKVFE